MRDIKKTPLVDLILQCVDCGEKQNAEDANSGQYDYHSFKSGRIFRANPAGLDDAAVLKFKQASWRCECCHEDYVENNSMGPYG